MDLPDFTPARGPAEPTVITDAVQALVNLGYGKSQAQDAVKQASRLPGVDAKIQSGEMSVENLFGLAMSAGNDSSTPEPPAPIPVDAEQPTNGELSQSASIPVAGSEDDAEQRNDTRPKGQISDIVKIEEFARKNPEAAAEVLRKHTEATRQISDVVKIEELARKDPEAAAKILQEHTNSTRQISDVIKIEEFARKNPEAAAEILNQGKPPAQDSHGLPAEPSKNHPPIQVYDAQTQSTQIATPEPVQSPQPGSQSPIQPPPLNNQPSMPGAPPIQPIPAPPVQPTSTPPQPAEPQSVQPVKPVQPQPSEPSENSGSMISGTLDAVQTGLDVAGTVGDAAGGAGAIADGANVAISLGRAATDPKNAGKHLFNAGVSLVSMVPGIGDFAKVFKYGPKAAKEAKAVAGAEKAASKGTGNLADSTPIPGKDQVDAIINRVEQQYAEKTGIPLMGNHGGGSGGSGSGSSGGSGSGGSGGNDDASSPGSQPPGDPLSDKNVKPMTDKITELAGTFGTLVTGGLAYAKTTELLNRAVLEYHKNIQGFNGELSAAYGRLESGRMGRDIQNAQDFGGSIAGLADAQNRLEESMRDFQAPFTEMGTDIQTGLTYLASLAVEIIDILDPFSELYGPLKNSIFKWLGMKEDADPRAPGGFFDKLREQADKMQQKRKL
jgi:hypothetical protein